MSLQAALLGVKSRHRGMIWGILSSVPEEIMSILMFDLD